MEKHYDEGLKLLKKGFFAEAICQFEQHLAQNDMDTRAWKGLAAAHEKLGHKKDTEICRQTAKDIDYRAWSRKVEAEIRHRSPLFGKQSKNY